MSGRELERGGSDGASGERQFAAAACGEMLELSYRQTKRVWRRYRERGGEGLQHGNAGRESNRGGVEVYYRGQRIPLHEIAEPVRRTAEPSPPAARIVVRKKAKPDHPWRLGYEMRMGRRAPLATPSVVPRPSASP